MDISIVILFVIIIIIMLVFWAVYSTFIYIKHDKEFDEKFDDAKKLNEKLRVYLEKSTIRLKNATENEKITIEYKEEMRALKEYREFYTYMEKKYHGKND